MNDIRSTLTVQDMLSNYRDTFNPPCDNPLSADQLAGTICHVINGSGVDLKVVLSMLKALFDSVGDVVHDLEAHGKVSKIDVELEEMMEDVEEEEEREDIIISDAWVLTGGDGRPLDVFLTDFFPTESDVWKAASTRYPAYPNRTVVPADVYFNLEIPSDNRES